jgi:hypothetical protein
MKEPQLLSSLSKEKTHGYYNAPIRRSRSSARFVSQGPRHCGRVYPRCWHLRGSLAHAQLIAETLGAVALGEFFDRLFAGDSEFRRWLDEVSEPPSDLELRGPRKVTGLLWVLGNHIKRALVIEHRKDGPPEPWMRSRHFTRRDPEHAGTSPFDDDFVSFG